MNNNKSNKVQAEIIGSPVGYLTVLEEVRVPSGERTLTAYRCRCVCGSEPTVIRGNLMSGRTKSCGCMSFKGREKAKIVVSIPGVYSGDIQGFMDKYGLNRRMATELHKGHASGEMSPDDVKQRLVLHKLRGSTATAKHLGARWGALTCIGIPPRGKGGVSLQMRCDCGNEKTVRLSSLNSGRTSSCGCRIKPKKEV